MDTPLQPSMVPFIRRPGRPNTSSFTFDRHTFSQRPALREIARPRGGRTSLSLVRVTPTPCCPRQHTARRRGARGTQGLLEHHPPPVEGDPALPLRLRSGRPGSSPGRRRRSTPRRRGSSSPPPKRAPTPAAPTRAGSSPPSASRRTPISSATASWPSGSTRHSAATSTPTPCRRRVSATVVPETVILEITATDPDPAQARDIAQAYANGLSGLVTELETPSGKTNAVDQGLDRRQRPVSTDPGLAPAGAQPRPGLRPRAAARPRPRGAARTAGHLRLVRRGRRPGDRRPDPRPHQHRPVGRQAPAGRGAAARPRRGPRPSGCCAPTCSTSRSTTTRRSSSSPARCPSEGKSTTAVNLADHPGDGQAAGGAGRVRPAPPADRGAPRPRRRRRHHQRADRQGRPQGRPADLRRHGLQVLSSGPIPPNPSELLQSNAMEKMLGDLRDDFDVVIIDAPPLLPVTDAALLAAQADGALIVVRHGKTTRDQLSTPSSGSRRSTPRRSAWSSTWPRTSGSVGPTGTATGMATATATATCPAPPASPTPQ